MIQLSLGQDGPNSLIKGEQTMGQHENACSIDQGQCHEEQNQECNLHEKLLCLADEAWKEVLKDKIKQEIEKTQGAKLNSLAKLVAETNGRKWAYMIQGKKACEEYKTQVRSLLSSIAE